MVAHNRLLHTYGGVDPRDGILQLRGDRLEGLGGGGVDQGAPAAGAGQVDCVAERRVDEGDGEAAVGCQLPVGEDGVGGGFGEDVVGVVVRGDVPDFACGDEEPREGGLGAPDGAGFVGAAEEMRRGDDAEDQDVQEVRDEDGWEGVEQEGLGGVDPAPGAVC